MPYDDKEELKFLIEKYLIEERGDEILQNSEENLKELGANKIKFSSDMNQLIEKNWDNPEENIYNLNE